MRDSAELESRWYARLAGSKDAVLSKFPEALLLGEDTETAGFILPMASKAIIDNSLAEHKVLTLFRVLD